MIWKTGMCKLFVVDTNKLHLRIFSTIKVDYDWKTNLIYSLFPVQGPRDKFGMEGGDPGEFLFK